MIISYKILFSSILLLIFIFIQNPAFAQNDKLISIKKQQKDLKRLKLLIEAHPDPYTQIPEKEFKKKWKAIESSLNQPLTQLEFFKKIASIVALIGDGHSSAYLPRNWLKKQRKALGAFAHEFHLTNDNELFVIKNFEDDELPLKSKILEINNISVDSFLNKIDPYISYEKTNFRNTIIDNDIEKYLYLAFGHSDSTKIKYISTDTSEMLLRNMDYKKWKKFQKDDKEEREIKIAKGEPYDYKEVKKGVGLISIFAFSAADFQNYKIFLNKTFKKIKKDSIHSLIIDIRGNYGGWPKIASKLFHYISDTHFKTMAKSTLKVSYAYRESFLSRYPYLRSHKPSFRQRRHFLNFEAILRNKYGTFVDESLFFNEAPEKKQYEFSGDCYLLINRDSYSAASSFAATFQCYQMGVIIGEETGGTKIFRANAFYEKLYKSGIIVGMSTTKMYNTCYDKEHEGIKPHIEYTPSILQIVSDIDTQLYYTLSVIKKIQKLKAEEKQ